MSSRIEHFYRSRDRPMAQPIIAVLDGSKLSDGQTVTIG